MENNINSQYTVTIFTKDQIGLLVTICSLFTRRGISIWNLVASATPVPGVHRIAIVAVNADEHSIQNLVKQIEKQVDVIKAEYTHDSDIFDYINKSIVR